MCFKVLQTKNRQKGMALILAIGFLAILSILGAVVLEVSTRDLKGTSSYLPKQQAFHVADRAVEYALTDEILTSMDPGDSLDLNSGTHKDIINMGGLEGELVEAELTYVDLPAVPIPGRFDGKFSVDMGQEMVAVLYHVSAKSKAPLNATSNIDASIIRMFASGGITTSGGKD